MTLDELFDTLDLEADGQLSRAELHESARQLEWHWPQAPIYAVLDRLTLAQPLSRERFVSCMNEIARDPHGPYGAVLRRVVPPWPSPTDESRAGADDARRQRAAVAVRPEQPGELCALLARLAGADVGKDYEQLLAELGPLAEPLPIEQTALLFIDLQRSFTSGAWKRSLGPRGAAEVEPIRLAFERCAAVLGERYRQVETMFTRCPFPPDSYDWHERIAAIVDPAQPYFVKPGNSVMWPPTNGFADWVNNLLERGKRWLVMGGCTLNSCVRVSSVETLERFGPAGLQVVVDLSLSGARTENYRRSPLFDGRSSVQSALNEMLAAGVHVAAHVTWE